MAGSNAVTSVLILGAGGVAVYVAYKYFQKQCAAGTGPSFICSMFPAAAAAAPAATTGGSTAAPTSGASTPGLTSWQIASLAMRNAAGSNSQNFDQWSWYFQYSPPVAGAPPGFGTNGSISAGMMAAIIAAGGGNRGALITADQFLGYYQTALHQAGLSGLGFAAAGVPRWLVYGRPYIVPRYLLGVR